MIVAGKLLIITGKQRCAGIARQILKVLSDLLGHENTDVSIKTTTNCFRPGFSIARLNVLK